MTLHFSNEEFAAEWKREKESCHECGLWSESYRDWLACPRCGVGTYVVSGGRAAVVGTETETR